MDSPRALIGNLLQQGLAAQRQGRLDVADRAFESALQIDPKQPDALQLLGLSARQRGDAQAAERWMRLSLQAAPAQAHVWNNLANVLDGAGRREEARECLEQALSLRPDYGDAHYNLARVLRALGRPALAAAALERAFAHQAANADMLHLRSGLEGDAENIAAGLESIDTALALAGPGASAALHHDRAVLLQRSHRHGEALQAHLRAQALGLAAADAAYNLGNTLQSLARNEEALAAYRLALARESGHRLALYDLARLRWRIGDPGFTEELDAAALAQPRATAADAIRGQLLWRAERFPDAAAAFEAGLKKQPDDSELLDGLARALMRCGSHAGALAAHERAIAGRPDSADFRVHHAASLLIAGSARQALEQAEAAVRLAPDDQHALAVLGLAWRANGDAREPWLNDGARLVQTYDLPAPPGFASAVDFHAALAAALAPMHSDARAPVDQTLRHGTQTFGNLLDRADPMLVALRALFTDAVSSYIAALPADPAHPFLRRRTARWRYADSWSSRLTRGGFHTDHVHPHGWISSVYYVIVPPSPAGSREGWLRFGQPDFDPGLGPLVQRMEQPRAGRLILFPSMMWHGTVPFSADGVRLTVAFDVVPDSAPL